MTNAQLEAKFHGLTDGVLPADRSRRLMELCWKIFELARGGASWHERRRYSPWPRARVFTRPCTSA